MKETIVPIDLNSDSALKTIEIQQSLIARMATASAAAKNWCVTVVSAVAVVAVDKANWKFAMIAVVPTLLFAAIDIYYLSLERSVRHSHLEFTKKLREGTADSDLLFAVGNLNLTFRETFSSACSRSIWPFYLLILLGLIAVAFLASNSS